MKVTVPLACVLTLGSLLTQRDAGPQQKPMPAVFTVTGSGWETCGDWSRSDTGFKLGYVIGHVEANTQIVSSLPNVPELQRIKESFDPPYGLKTGDYVNAIDKFCGDPYNSRIALANGMAFVAATLSGAPPPDEKLVGYLRCIGAAGADAGRIRDCNNR